MSSWGKRPDMIVHEDEPFNAEPPPSALAGRHRTSIDAFYSRNHGPVPELDVPSWQLTVDGLVQRPITLSLDELRDRFEQHTLEATLQCAGNGRSGLIAVRDIPGEAPWGFTATSTAEWTGARLADVLAHAGVVDGAAHVAFVAPDEATDAVPPQPYGSSIPLHKAICPEVLLAWSMNGAPLTPIHGAPLRVVVPGYIGARSVKWVERITVQDVPSDNFFQAVAYRVLPPETDPETAGPGDGISLSSVALNCAILAPDDGAAVDPGPLEVTGYAYAGDDRTVTRVDVSCDGGTSWVQADLDTPTGPWTWQHWRTTLVVDGATTLLARAWDSTGALQPESPADLWNPKGYANNSWSRVHVRPR